MDHHLSATQFSDVLPRRPHASAAWNTFALHVVGPTPHFAATFSDHVITVMESGTFRARQEVAGGRTTQGWCGPGCVGILPADTATTWEAAGVPESSRAVSLFIPDAFLSRVISQDWNVDRRKVELLPRSLVRDPVLAGVVTDLALEARHGSPSGHVYAESACEFLAHHLIRAHSSLTAPPPRYRGGLAGRPLRLVLDYIQDSLDRPIALGQLADLVRLSPRHFERAFRQSMGMAPHTYLMERRVAAARQLLLDQPSLAVGEIATRVGFSSSSHLASTFRRQTGYAPVAFRRLHASRDKATPPRPVVI